MRPLRRAGLIACAVIALAMIVPGRAVAALAGAAVPTVTAAPTLDPTAALAAWPADPALPLPWDVVDMRPADEPTTVHLATDGHFLYVRFDAMQRGPVVATQHSDDTVTGGSQSNGALAWGNDDVVWVDLWPTGPSGFEYQFEANANGSHNEASSENSAFAPQWTSRGAIHDGGYTVTMAIPLNVIHGAHSGTWRAQFIRYTRASGAQTIWSYEPGQTNADDPARAGSLTLTIAALKAPVPPPRIAAYALGALAAPSAGGNTSRVGADVSVPVTPTVALFATFHPDYSNVELDQQTIAPSVYTRPQNEVRPFFTQAASYYNNDFPAWAATGNREFLYTPAIPTPASGYAFEGKQGDFAFAGFDALASTRNDSAAAFSYTSPDTRWNAAYQHEQADIPGIVDTVNVAGFKWTDTKYLNGYVNAATDRGTNVLDPAQGNSLDAGFGYGSPKFAFYAVTRDIGQYFNPVDGYVWHPGVAGYALFSSRIWTFDASSTLAAIGIGGFLDRYQGPTYGQSQSDNSLQLDVLTKSAWDLQLSTGSDYWRFGPTLEPISQNAGFTLTYHSGLQTNNASNFPNHGSSATPTQVQFYTGAYGGGRLDTWFRTSTIKAGEKGFVTLTLDDTAQYFTSGTDNVQWFEGIAYSYQINRDSSFAIGVRKVVGFPPQPNGGGNCAGTCTNVSIAYHLRLTNEEFYLAYGNPNTLITVPQAILKIIFYVGGQKGT